MVGAPVDGTFALLGLIAAVMVGVNLYFLLRLLPRRGGPPDLASVILVVGLFVGSLGLWGAVIYAAQSPGTASFTAVLIAGNSMMAVAGAWLIALFLRAEERHLTPHRWTWPVLLAALLLGNELLMGVAFVLLGATPAPAVGTEGVVALLATAVDSVWFTAAMVANMVALLVWLPIDRAVRSPLLALAATVLVVPWALADPIVGALAMAAGMTVAFVLLFSAVGGPSAVSARRLRVAVAVAAGFAAMAAGFVASLLAPPGPFAAVPFAVANLGVMAVESVWLLRWTLDGAPADDGPTLPLFRRPAATTAFLAFGFVAEWLMAAGLLLAINGPDALAVGGGGGPVGLVATGIEQVALVTATPYFLGLMGLEMGALVVARMRRATERPQRVRLGLALGTYGVYTVLAPAAIGTWALLPGAWPNVGALGPVSALTVPAIVASYALFVGLAFLFGRRSYCSVLCPSAVMYGGEFSQKLIPATRESPVARHHVLGGRWRGLALGLAVGSWVTLAAVVALSVWDSTYGGTFLPAGFDPSVLYAAGIWNTLWYGFFLTIPYVGMSPSRNWGFCTTGTLLGAVGALGFYRKEALDRDVCRACVTRECGQACEVGLVDMPAALARDGVFRSSKCVGAHDCEVACPYGNLVSRDVRDVVRRWLHLPDRHGRPHPRTTGPLLPVVAAGIPAAAPVSAGTPANP